MEEAVRAALVEQMRIVHHAVNSGTMDKDTINGALAVMHGVLYPEAVSVSVVAAADPEPAVADVDTVSEEDVGSEYDQEGDDHTTHGRRHRKRK